MLNIDISSDIDAAMKEVGDFFRSQIPFATSVAINNTIFDVRREVVEDTWFKSFKVRNRNMPRVLFNVTKRASKANLVAMLTQNHNLKGGERKWVERQMTGGVKKGSGGGRVAIPKEPDTMRTPTGRIKASLKPRRLEKTPGVFVIKRGTKTLIMKRTKKSTKLLYSIVPSAKISKRFTFEEDTIATTIRVFSGYWRLAMNAAIAKSRFR